MEHIKTIIEELKALFEDSIGWNIIFDVLTLISYFLALYFNKYLLMFMIVLIYLFRFYNLYNNDDPYEDEEVEDDEPRTTLSNRTHFQKMLSRFITEDEEHNAAADCYYNITTLAEMFNKEKNEVNKIILYLSLNGYLNDYEYFPFSPNPLEREFAQEHSIKAIVQAIKSFTDDAFAYNQKEIFQFLDDPKYIISQMFILTLSPNRITYTYQVGNLEHDDVVTKANLRLLLDKVENDKIITDFNLEWFIDEIRECID